MKSSAANEAVNPNTSNSTASDKPYTADAVSTANDVGTSAAVNNVKNQIEIEKAKSVANSDSAVRNAADLQLSGTETTLQVMQAQYKVQEGMASTLTQILTILQSNRGASTSSQQQSASNLANTLSPQSNAPQISHGEAPIGVKRMAY